MPLLGVADTNDNPSGSRSDTRTLVASAGPAFVSVTVNVIVSPTFGAGLLTVLASARSAPGGPAARPEPPFAGIADAPASTTAAAIPSLVITCRAFVLTPSQSLPCWKNRRRGGGCQACGGRLLRLLSSGCRASSGERPSSHGSRCSSRKPGPAFWRSSGSLESARPSSGARPSTALGTAARACSPRGRRSQRRSSPLPVSPTCSPVSPTMSSRRSRAVQREAVDVALLRARASRCPSGECWAPRCSRSSGSWLPAARSCSPSTTSSGSTRPPRQRSGSRCAASGRNPFERCWRCAPRRRTDRSGWCFRTSGSSARARTAFRRRVASHPLAGARADVPATDTRPDRAALGWERAVCARNRPRVWSKRTPIDARPAARPESLQALVAARVRTLPAETRAALLRAAALARPDLRLVEAAALAPAEEAGLVRVAADDRVEFVHPLFASAVYSSAPRGAPPRGSHGARCRCRRSGGDSSATSRSPARPGRRRWPRHSGTRLDAPDARRTRDGGGARPSSRFDCSPRATAPGRAPARCGRRSLSSPATSSAPDACWRSSEESSSPATSWPGRR